MAELKPKIDEVVLLALPFFSLPRNEKEAAIILKQKAGIYGQVIREVASVPNRALIFCNPGLGLNSTQMQRIFAFAKRVLGNRLLLGPERESITTFFMHVDFSGINLSPSVKVLAYGEHGGPHDCVNSWGRVFRSFLENGKGRRVESVTQPPEYIIRVGDDNSVQSWKKRKKKLKKELPSLRRGRKGVIR